jgi:hypothetical protein
MVVTAGGAELLGTIRQKHPVADAQFPILAKAIRLSFGAKRTPNAILGWFDRGNRHAVGQESQRAAASFAANILEIEKLPAGLTDKHFHLDRIRNSVEMRHGWVGSPQTQLLPEGG